MVFPPAATGAAPPAKPGVWAGAGALLFGLRFLHQRRDLWSLATVPALLTLVLGAAGGGSGLYLGYHYTHQLLAAHAAPASGGLFPFLGGLLVALLVGVLGVLLGTSLAVPLSGPALERIAAATQLHLGLQPAEQGLYTFAHSLAATALTWAGGLLGVGVLLLLGVLVPPLLPVTLALKGALLALLLTFDLGDHAFSLLGLPLGERIAWLRAHLGAALGFGTAAALLLCVPVLGLFVLPAAVAGVTSLVAVSRPGARRGPSKLLEQST